MAIRVGACALCRVVSHHARVASAPQGARVIPPGGLSKVVILKSLRDALVHREGTGAGAGEQEEDERVRGGLLKVVRVVVNVAKGKALQARGGEVEVDGGAHGPEEHEGGGAGEQTNRDEHAAPELGVVVQRRPEVRVAREEGEVGLDNKIDKAIKAAPGYMVKTY